MTGTLVGQLPKVPDLAPLTPLLLPCYESVVASLTAIFRLPRRQDYSVAKAENTVAGRH